MLVVDSTTPLPAGQMVCGRGLPASGRAQSRMLVAERQGKHVEGESRRSAWVRRADCCVCRADLATPTNWTNHVVLRDVEITLSPGWRRADRAVYRAVFVPGASEHHERGSVLDGDSLHQFRAYWA